MLASLLVYAILLLPAVWGFGLTESGNSYIVDTEGGLIFTVERTSGDITSMKFNGIEAQDGSKRSHIASGIGASCSWMRGGNSNNYIKITCTAGSVTHITAEPSVGELRFIARLRSSSVPNGIPPANIKGGTAIEGSDVFTVSGQTRSKFYSSRQFIDDAVKGVTGSGIGVYMVVYGQGFESASGGPFFRDIDNQGGDQQELYYYMVQLGPYTNRVLQDGSPRSIGLSLSANSALVFTTGAAPSANIASTAWCRKLAEVVSLEKQAISLRSSPPYMSVGFSNSAAQYWARTDTSGNFVSPYMKPGTYTMTLYKVELAVASQSVSVSAGGTATSNIASTESNPTTIWQIGDFDGTPRGFLNADKIETMHPSDSRMSNWGPITWSVGSNINQFPMAIFQAIGGVTINFSLSSSQIGARTLEIATTLAFAGGRPVAQVNNWTSATPAVPNQPDSRGVTRGTWRGNNIRYTYNIPSGTLVAGSNKIVITVASGSSGDRFLSPNIVFDGLRLY
ncbi:hypothetical protein PQX77_013859 [Marasmius sp. AFHP31]|nr:hypothetical protein PQX77_013859 [Marasmius sp. AFHP31]